MLVLEIQEEGIGDVEIRASVTVQFPLLCPALSCVGLVVKGCDCCFATLSIRLHMQAAAALGRRVLPTL